MKPKGKPERHFEEAEQARIILEAVTLGDDAVCAKYSIATRSLRRWRKKLKDGKCPELADSVREKRRELDRVWAEKIPGCLSGCIDFITDASRQMNKKDPDAVHAMAGAMKLVSEVAVTWKVIDARISQQTDSNGKATGPVPSGTNVVPIRSTG